MALEIGCLGNGTVEASSLAAHRGLKDDCYENENLICAVVRHFDHMCRRYRVVGM